MLRKKQFTALLQQHAYDELFISEMGWNNPRQRSNIPLTIDDTIYTVSPVAERSGFSVFSCKVDSMPTSSCIRKIDNQLRRSANDYICIYYRNQGDEQAWAAPVNTTEKREVIIIEYEANEAKVQFLYEKVGNLSFELTEQTTISDVRERISGEFKVNGEKLTKSFYDGFRKEHNAFADFITGIDDHIDAKNNRAKQWYASVMLNRLMFCYFIQKKGFLNADTNYLRNKLHEVQEQEGHNKFFGSFYKAFLCRLFHDGLNAPRHDNAFEDRFGRIPYLNGGMFDVHQIEKDYADIDIADDAFQRLFDFFDKWRWHLDYRVTATGKDINPDVLGYIFEQYINDRAQMGAYYTKEDITEYISKNCIIPFLVDKAGIKNIADLVKNSGGQYIYPAVRHGYSADWQQRIPQNIAVGINTNEPKLLERRSDWNTPTPEAFGLPTEIWRETIERLQRCDNILQKIRQGEIRSINDFITYNLNIRQFVQDVLEKTDDHLLIKHFFDALKSITILDPTCGSGAFLFAAMNILEPLYETCLNRMESFNLDNPRLFTAELDEIKNHYRSNRQYYIYKTIILRNLYGVDIMAEATEIAKLRLFLRMVAVVDADMRQDNLGLDPLPDVDFNIRCGNTLVGYATEQELGNSLSFGSDLIEQIANLELKEKITTQMQLVADTFDLFKSAQLNPAISFAEQKTAKEQLRNRLAELNDLLNRKMFATTVVGDTITYEQYLENYQPFHWLAEFYQIIHENKGFDVIIGNPPYVVYSEKTSNYKIQNYESYDCKDLYAYVIERSLKIKNEHSSLGMIVPISIVSTDGFLTLRKIMYKNTECLYFSNYAMRPSKLFDGADKHLSIFIARDKSEKARLFTSKYHRWTPNERNVLFDKISYLKIDDAVLYMKSVPKISSPLELSVLKKIIRDSAISFSSTDCSNYLVCHTRKLRYFVQFLDCAPIIYNEDGSIRETSELKKHYYASDEDRYAAIATYLSTLFFWFFLSFSDCRNLNKREVDAFPFNLKSSAIKLEVSRLGKEIVKNLQDNSTYTVSNYKQYGQLSIQTFQPRLSKNIADKIDTLLAKHYCFTQEELDFIINYDIKYRMGDNLNVEEED